MRGDRKGVGARFVSNVADAERVRRPMDSIGRTARHAGYGRSAFGEALLAISRLVFPTMLLLAAAAAALIYGNEPARWLGDLDVGGKPFDTGLLALPVTLFIVQMTNRRYGAGYAFLQLLGAAVLAIAAALYVGDDLVLLRGAALPSLRMIAAFGCGLFVAQLFSIVVFDRLRGPRWWQAPLFASLFGGAALAAVAYPIAYLGSGADWLQPMLSYIGANVVAAIVLLVPYWLLRAMIAPLPGFGGY